MSRGPVLASALLLALAATFVQSIALSQRVNACSCAPPPSMAELAARDDVAIFTGTVGQRAGELVPVAVEAWYHGAQPRDIVWMSGGFGDDGMCDLLLTPGERRFMVIHALEQPFSANTCVPNALLGTAAGNALVSEAEAVFGIGQAPPTPTPLPEQPFDLTPLFGGGMAWVLGGVLAALVLFGLAALVARHRPLS